MKIKKTKIGFFLYRLGLLAVFFLLIQVPPMAIEIGNRRPDNQGVAIVMSALFVLIFLFIINRAYHVYQSYDQLPKHQGIKVGLIIRSYIAIMVGMMAFGWLNQVFFHQTSTANNDLIRQMLNHNMLITIVFVLSTFTLTPIAEELIFRGILTNLFFKPTSFWPKVVLSGVIFSTAHSSTTIVSFLLYCYMGMVLAYAYRTTGDLRNSMAIHAINNLIAILLMLHLV